MSSNPFTSAIEVPVGPAPKSLPAPAPSNIVKESTIGRSIDAQEFGVIAGMVFRNFITGETVNVSPVSYAELRRITRQDGQARGLLRLLTMPIANAKWDVLTPQEDNKVIAGAKSEEVSGSNSSPERDLIAENFFKPFADGGMSIPFGDIIASLALAIRDGFKVFEKVFMLNSRGRVVLRKLAYRENDTVTLLSDDHGDFNGFRQQTYFNGRWIDVTIPKEKSLLYTFGKEESQSYLYGSPLFLPVYYHMDKKHKLYYISHVAYQMLAIPPRIGKVPVGAEDEVKKKFLRDLASLGFNSAMYMPSDFEVEPFESSRTLADMIPMIEHHNAMAAKAVLGQFMDLTQSATGKLAGEQQDVFVMGIVSVLRDIEKIFNNWVIPQIVDFNFSSRVYPKLRARAFTDSDQQALREIFVQIMTAGANHTSPEFIVKLEQKMAGMLDMKDLDYEKIEKEQVEAAKKMRAVENQRAGALAQARAAGGNPNRTGKQNAPGDANKEGNK